MPSPRRYWVNVISLDHVKLAIEGGFTQANHGKRSGLESLREGDVLIFYSPRETRPKSAKPVQEFTGAGVVQSRKPYQVEISDEWKPWRLDLKYALPVKKAGIKKLIDRLEFIKKKKKWGYYLRRSLFPITEHDGTLILQRMGVDNFWTWRKLAEGDKERSPSTKDIA